ncbi:DUF4347 domain-containing protein [Cyanobium sp. ATX-6F1]|uniref:DUF4347 domain-containing protein n=1 Tax=Cyanobium sp. ATX-6F1 TaxID=3137388 RepID=UPI0039BDA4DC
MEFADQALNLQSDRLNPGDIVPLEPWSTGSETGLLLPLLEASTQGQLNDPVFLLQEAPPPNPDQSWPALVDHPILISGLEQGSYSLSVAPAASGDWLTDSSAPQSSPALPGRQLIFVDGGLSDAHDLVGQIQQTADPSTTVVTLLDPQQNGLAQISAALAGQSNLAAIHILGHGSSGVLQLGSKLLSQSDLEAQAELLSGWGSALQETGDILLYGCDAGYGTAGFAFASTLARLTGADVAASVDATGSAALGGNWFLESQVGTIETTALSPDYQDLLAVEPWLGISNALASVVNRLDGIGIGLPVDASSALAGDGPLGILTALRDALASATGDGAVVASSLNMELNGLIGTSDVTYVTWAANTLSLNLDQTVTDSLDLTLGEGSPITVAGSLDASIALGASATFTLNAGGTALQSWSLNLSLSDIDVDVSSLTLAGDLGLASFEASAISLAIDPGLTLSLTTGSSQASGPITVDFSDVNDPLDPGPDVDDLTFSASIQIASALGEFPTQSLTLAWQDIESTDSIQVSGSAVTTALDLIHDLAGSLQDGLNELGTKAQELADSVLGNDIFSDDTPLPLVGGTLKDLLDLRSIIDGVIGAGSAVVDYLAVRDLTTTTLSFDTSIGDVLVLTDGKEVHLIEDTASAEDIERILGFFNSIGQGKARVVEVSGADATTREFRIGAQGTLSSLPTLSIASIQAATLVDGEPSNSKTLTLAATGDVVALRLGSGAEAEYAVVDATATAEAFAAAIAELSSIGAGNVAVVETTTTGARSFTITLSGTATTQLSGLAVVAQPLTTASIAGASYSELTGLSFSEIEDSLPSFDALSSVLAERIETSLADFLSGTLGVSVDVGLDQDGLTFTLAPTRFGVEDQLSFDLGADLAAAGITLDTSLQADVEADVEAWLDIGLTFGLDLSRLAIDVATISSGSPTFDGTTYTLSIQNPTGTYVITDGNELTELSTQLSASQIEEALAAWSSIGGDNIVVTAVGEDFEILIKPGATIPGGLQIAPQTPSASDFFIQFDQINAHAAIDVLGTADLAADLAGATGTLAATVDASLVVDVAVVITNNDNVAVLSAAAGTADTYTLTLTGVAGQYEIAVGQISLVLDSSLTDDPDTAAAAESLEAALNAGLDLGARSFVVEASGANTFTISFSSPPAFVAASGTTVSGTLLTLNPAAGAWSISLDGTTIALLGTNGSPPSAEQIATILNADPTVENWGGAVVLDALDAAPSLTSGNAEQATLNGDKLSVLVSAGTYTLTVGTTNVSLAYDATDAALTTALNALATNGTYEVELISATVQPAVFRITFIGNFIPDSYDIRFAQAPALTLDNTAVPRRINYADLGALRIDVAAESDLDLAITGTGSISTSDNFLNFSGSFDVAASNIDIFNLSAPLLYAISFEGVLTMDNYFRISGELNFAQQQGPLTFSDGRVVDDAIYSVLSGNNIDVFAGYLDPTADGNDGDSQGIRIEDIAFTLVTYKDGIGADATNADFRALKSTGGSAELVGVEGVQVALTDFSLEVNTSTAAGSLVLDFNPGGSQSGSEVFSLVDDATPSSTETISIDFDGDQGKLFGASGTLTLQILAYLMAEATFTLKRRSLTLSGGSAPEGEFDLVTFELENVFAYAGTGVIDVAGSEGLGADGRFSQDDLDAIDEDPSLYDGTGFAVADGRLGLAMLQGAEAASEPRDSRSYMAITSELGSAQLLGLPSEFEVQAFNIAVELNRASGVAADGSTQATALDWSTALGANNPTFFAESSDPRQLTYAGAFTRIAGELNLKAFDVVEVNGGFELTIQEADVSFDPSASTPVIDLDNAELLQLSISINDPDGDGGPGKGLRVGAADGVNFSIDEGRFIYTSLQANPADRSTFPAKYYSIQAEVNGAELNGLGEGIDITATSLNVLSNGLSGVAPSGAPDALDWTSMVDLSPADDTFTATAISGATTAGLSIGGELAINLDGFVLARGGFSFVEQTGLELTDSTALTSTALSDVTLQTISLSEVDLFVGTGGAWNKDSDGVIQALDLSNATGFSIENANLEIATVSETAGQRRRWMGLAASVSQLDLVGLPSDLLELRSLNVLYNKTDPASGSRLDWSNLVSTTEADNTDGHLNGLAEEIQSLTSTTDLSVSGDVALNLEGAVLATGTIGVSLKSGLSIDDCNVNVDNASLLLVELSDLDVFVGSGGAFTREDASDPDSAVTGIHTDEAVGFSVSGANLDLAVLQEVPPTTGGGTARSWLGLAGSLESMAPVGLPDGITIEVNNLKVLFNGPDSSTAPERIDWQALAEQDDDLFGIDDTGLAELSSGTSLSIAGDLLVSVDNAITISGSVALEQRELALDLDGDFQAESYSALTLGAKNLQAFVGTGPADSDDDQQVDSNTELEANGALGVAIRVDELALALIAPVPTAGVPSTRSYFSLKASGNAALIGVEGITLSGSVAVEVNRGRDGATTIDALNFKELSADALSEGLDEDLEGLVVTTGPLSTDRVVLGFDSTAQVLSVAGSVDIVISEFIQVQGNFAFEQSDALQEVVLADASSTTLDVSVLKIGASDVKVFVGTGGPYFLANDATSDSATGVALTIDAFGLALMRTESGATGPSGSFYALTGTGGGALVGLEDILTMAVTDMSVAVNGGSLIPAGGGPATTAAVDFSETDFGAGAGGGIEIPTGIGASMILGANPSFNGESLRASGDVEISIGGFVEISGSVALERKGGITATLSDGSTKTLSMLSFGGSGLDAFIGDPGVDGDATDDKGLVVDGASFGLALLTPDDVADASRYYAFEASIDAVVLTGFDPFNLSITDVAISGNGGSDVLNPRRVVDFSQGYTQGSGAAQDFAISTGTTPDSVVLSGSEAEIKARGTVTLGVTVDTLSVELSGSVAVRIGSADLILADGSAVNDANAIEVGISNAAIEIDTDTTDAANELISYGSAANVNIGLAYYTSTDPTDARSWLGFKVAGGELSGGSGGVSGEISNISASYNAVFGQTTPDPTEAVNFRTSFDGALLVETGGLDAEGNPTTIALAMGSGGINLQADAALTIDEYFYVSGTFGLESSTGTIDISKTGVVQEVAVSIRSVQVTGAQAFAGTGGPYRQGDGSINYEAAGLALEDVNFVLYRYTEVGGSTRSWDVVYAEASTAALVGIDGLTLRSDLIRIKVNTAALDGSFVRFNEDIDFDGDGTSETIISYVSVLKEVSTHAVLAIDEYVYIESVLTFKTESGVDVVLTQPSSGAEDTMALRKTMAVTTVTATDANIFIGTGGPYFQPDGSKEEAGAAGIVIENLDLELNLFKSEVANDRSSFFALDASASDIKVVGVDPAIFKFDVENLKIEVNSGNDIRGRVIDFQATNALTGDPADDFAYDFDTKLISVSAEELTLSVGGFLQINGSFAMSKQDGRTVTLSDISQTREVVNLVTFGFDNLNVFAGEGRYDFSKPVEEQTDEPSGLLISGGQLAVALFNPLAPAAEGYYAISASLGTAELVGIDVGSTDASPLSASGYQVQINSGVTKLGAASKVGIDFTAFEDPFTVQTGGEEVEFSFSSPTERVAIDHARLTIGDFVYVSGSFALERRIGGSVTLGAGLQNDVQLNNVNTLVIGAKDVDLFVGDGPYFVDADNDGVYENVNDGLDGRPEAVGLAIENGMFALVVSREVANTGASQTKYTALKASADFVGFVGIDDFQLSASGVSIDYNSVSGPGVDVGGTSSAINYADDPLDVFGDESVIFDVATRVLRASVDNATLQIGSYVSLTGGSRLREGRGIGGCGALQRWQHRHGIGPEDRSQRCQPVYRYGWSLCQRQQR